ncbi:anthranilate synthase component II [Vagococcus humatus]|uniref:Aminodeoxychorismate/anthranilate synthase component II n=1 Tax=Vagococcus humatus TaxID=1889241 RepID=A0A3R9YX23_9ENTE|nr:aminodeoxychorismate/anthranilate synthase component II [Vagococcus humatus]RST89407.1 aminodeoxychorismate/anthranilate synthase component II [Vagococcus humatus]
MRLVMIDNKDSFVYNLVAYLNELNQEVLVLDSQDCSFEKLNQLKPDGIIISPGPGSPETSFLSKELILHLSKKWPTLGVCLGHQLLAYGYGGQVICGEKPIHGKLSKINTNQTGIFKDLPEEFEVVRYHSLIVDPETLPEEIQIDGVTDEGVIMGLSHKTYPWYSVQFHPEALLTQYGHEMLQNFVAICQECQTYAS